MIMRSAVLKRIGARLVVETAPLPKLQPDEVLLEMLYSPVNPSDLLYTRGLYGRKPQLPCVPGFEGVGIVKEVGSSGMHSAKGQLACVGQLDQGTLHAGERVLVDTRSRQTARPHDHRPIRVQRPQGPSQLAGQPSYSIWTTCSLQAKQERLLQDDR